MRVKASRKLHKESQQAKREGVPAGGAIRRKKERKYEKTWRKKRKEGKEMNRKQMNE